MVASCCCKDESMDSVMGELADQGMNLLHAKEQCVGKIGISG